MSDADCTPGRESRSVAASVFENSCQICLVVRLCSFYFAFARLSLICELLLQVLREFTARPRDGKMYTQEKLVAKFTRKLNRCAQLKVHENVVTLLD